MQAYLQTSFAIFHTPKIKIAVFTPDSPSHLNFKAQPLEVAAKNRESLDV